jgi:purine-binding chemotaxis protein CheW
MIQEYLSFHLNNELFGIHLLKVMEVLEKQVITEIPNSPADIIGIINFRGDVVPVFDTSLRLNLKPWDQRKSFVIAVLDLVNHGEPFRIGAIVDSVSDVFTINENDIKPVPPMGNKLKAELIRGVVRKDNQFILLIDVDMTFIDNWQQQK